MKSRTLIIALSILLIIASPAFAANFSSWGSVNLTEEEGLRLESSFKQSLPINNLAIFVSLDLYQSSKRDQFWNNYLVPAIGIEYNFPLELIKAFNWQNYSLGLIGQVEIYTDIDLQILTFHPYFNWGFGGRFSTYLPYSSWGNLEYTELEGLLLETAFKQGVQWKQFVVYGSFQIRQSSYRHQLWNNRVTPRIGIEYILPIKIFKKGWDGYRIGVNAGYHISTDEKVVIFTAMFYLLNWSFGGTNLIKKTF